MSQQIGAAVYVETSARAALRTAISAFEVAALAAMGKLAVGGGKATPPHSPPSSLAQQRFGSVSPGDSLERADRFWDNRQQQQGTTRLARTTSEHARKTGSLGSSRSCSLSSKTRSSISIPSISSASSGSSKTPKGSRKSSSATGSGNGGERMITIKCGRLNEDKTYEEIEVEVPAPIYDTIQLYNDASTSPGGGGGGALMSARGAKERRSLGSKLRNLFTSKS